MAVAATRAYAQSVMAEERVRVEEALARLLAARVDALPAGLAEPVRYALQAGGKRLRPVLVVSAYRAMRECQSAALYDAACGIEVLHTYSLLHDDLPCMDNNDLRRGHATTHRVFGVRRATLAGALMIPLACAALERGAAALGLGGIARARVVRELTGAAGAAGMVGGQLLDLAAEGEAVSLPELQAIHARKTGALFAACLRIGARLAEADESTIDAFGRCGRSLGLAFQVMDDVLDVTGDAHALGKTAGRDRENGKATYPSLMGVAAARAEAARAARESVAALHGAGIHAVALESLVEFVVDRDR